MEQLQQAGEKGAYLYGADEKMLGGLNSFYLLVDKPEVYGLPPDPKMPTPQSKAELAVVRAGRGGAGAHGRRQLPHRGGGTMSSTFFTAAPEWRWLIILYFFLGGLAGGCYFLAVLMDLFGRPADRRLARIGYLVAFPAVCVCGLLLTWISPGPSASGTCCCSRAPGARC